MPEENWKKEFTFYAVALYRNGYYTEAALVGCIMFEKAVYYLLEEKKINKYQIRKWCKEENNINKTKYGELQYAIIKMCEYYSFEDSVKLYIDEIRKNNRNEIIHEKNLNQIESKDIKFMVDFIWSIFDPDTYKQYEGKISKIKFKSADYVIRSVRRPLIKQISDETVKDFDFKWLHPSDFKELNELREKFISLKSKINKELFAKHYQDLKIDIISQVDTTSAYVWMGINFKDQKKSRIESTSISILGTPLDLRIYMDFGGRALQARQDYYKFLNSDKFRNFWRKDKIDRKEIKIFNIDWYCFIDESWSLNELLTGPGIKNQIKDAENMLKPYEHDNDKIISWNRLLCGYIIKRQTIPYNTIENKLKDIIDFYYCFKDFQDQQNKISI